MVIAVQCPNEHEFTFNDDDLDDRDSHVKCPVPRCRERVFVDFEDDEE